MTTVLAAVAAVAFLLLAAILSAAEATLVHVSAARAAAIAVETANKRGKQLVTLLARRERILGAVLTIRILIQVAAIVTARLVFNGGHTTGEWIAIGAGLVVLLAAGELVPKAIVVVTTDRVALAVTPVIWFISKLPVASQVGRVIAGLTRRILPTVPQEAQQVSEEELLAFAEVAAEADVIESEERQLIASIIEFGDTIVREVMVPRPDMVTFDKDFRVADALEVIVLNGLSRIPVTGEDIEDIVGFAYVKDLVRAERDGREDEVVGCHLRPVRVVPEQQKVAHLLREMQQQKFHMAIVVDEYGGTAGLVTLEDLIEELIGEIVDEYDVEEPMAEPLADGSFRVDARMPLDEVNDLLGAELPDGEWDTIGGLVFETFGRVPVQGESVEIGDHRLTAARVQGRRIGRVRIERIRV